MIIYSILLAVIFYVFGALTAWVYMRGKIKDLREFAENQQRLRLEYLDRCINKAGEILEALPDLEERK